MEHELTTATLFWLFVPMPLVLLASVVTYFTGRRYFRLRRIAREGLR